MGTWAPGVVCLSIVAAAFSACSAPPDASEIAGDEPFEEDVDTSRASATACKSPVTATLNEHVAVNRAQREPIFFLNAYYANGPDHEFISYSGAQTVTLYLHVSSGWTTNPAKCIPDDPCGDGVKQQYEECDGADFGTATCFSQTGTSGPLHCNNSCRIDTTDCKAVCGNGVTDMGEDCDGNDFSNLDCTEVDDAFLPGKGIKCTTCRLDVSACRRPTCGDGVRQTTEVCDGTDLPKRRCSDLGPISTLFPDGQLKCNATCTDYDTSACRSPCGDGVLDPGEECDGAFRSPEAASRTCADYVYKQAFPFGNWVPYANGPVTCGGCMFDLSACKPRPGCYYGFKSQGGAVVPTITCI